jgi:hypothetical protein
MCPELELFAQLDRYEVVAALTARLLARLA